MAGTGGSGELVPPLPLFDSLHCFTLAIGQKPLTPGSGLQVHGRGSRLRSRISAIPLTTLAAHRMSKPHGVHPRLIPPAPSARPSLAMLQQLEGIDADCGWAVWYSVWKAGGSALPGPVSAEEREFLIARFEAAGSKLPELRAEFEVLGQFACGERDAHAAADALFTVAEWAVEKHMPLIAIYCAEASASLAPASSSKALAAGRTNRHFGDLVSRADLYHERAVPLARKSRNWRIYVRAHLGKGYIKKALGDNAAARAHFFTAARAAKILSGEKWLAGQTHHDLLVLAAEEGDFHAALLYTQAALESYPRHHSRIPGLCHDFAFVLLRMGLFGEARKLLDAVMRSRMPPQDQVIGWSTLAHAAAGARDVAEYRTAADNMLRMVGLFDLHAAAAFSNLACGSQLLGLWADAEQYALRSLHISEQRQQSESIAVAKAVLETLGGTHPWHDHVAITSDLYHRAVDLIPALTARLINWRGPTYRARKLPTRQRQAA